MNISHLIHASQKPEIYTPGTAVMWTDDHISRQLLDTHLSQETDLASRRQPAIEATIKWVLDQALNMPLSILDLGCGPGLYAEPLARIGHRVTGMDFSARSITHAKNSAAQKNLDIHYVNQDYLLLDQENQYDLVMMIFTDFGVLFPGQREILIKRIYKALKPGGLFIFDVLNLNWKNTLEKGWDISPQGFWRDQPHIVLSKAFSYDYENVELNQHLVIEDKGWELYRFYIHRFSPGNLKDILDPHGFQGTTCHDSLLERSPLHRPEDLTFCVATK